MDRNPLGFSAWVESHPLDAHFSVRISNFLNHDQRKLLQQMKATAKTEVRAAECLGDRLHNRCTSARGDSNPILSDATIFSVKISNSLAYDRKEALQSVWLLLAASTNPRLKDDLESIGSARVENPIPSPECLIFSSRLEFVNFTIDRKSASSRSDEVAGVVKAMDC
ncbi:hypothetical protein AVEN_264634-1 [Araneus ventricosus]|uniref:Uncharacterized protein n=1 Tax=Araneus ventricosus TaxID=182803 RepID=A0A4Y2T2R0_ARAVE|nr:hypothetical protein AVEN_264634-1 [Araneus ventricosus]